MTMDNPCRKVEQLGTDVVDRLKGMLEVDVRPSLRPDVSNYAKGQYW